MTRATTASSWVVRIAHLRLDRELLERAPPDLTDLGASLSRVLTGRARGRASGPAPGEPRLGSLAHTVAEAIYARVNGALQAPREPPARSPAAGEGEP